MGEDSKEKSPLVPRLRFPEFRGAGDWVEMSLGEIGEIVTGKTPSTSDDSLWNGDIQFVTPTDISEEKYQWSTQRSVAINANTKVLPLHSTMFTCIASIGKMALSVKPCITNQQINTVIPNKDYENEFVYYSLLNIVPLIKGTQANSTLPIINKTEFSKFTIPVPRVHDEQQKIADCLSSLDELIAAETQKLDALKTHKKGLMYQLFPRAGETVPRLRFPEFREAGEWESVPMGSLLARNPEYGVNAPASPFSEDRPTYLRITDIDEDGRFLSASKVSVDIVATDDNYLEPGDIVLARTGASVGKSYRYRKEDGRLVFAGFLIRIRPEPKKIDPIFLANFLTTQQYWDWVGVTSARSGQPGINGTEYSSLPVPVPSLAEDDKRLSEQRRIAECLSSLDDLITAQSQKIGALKAHKKGLMQQLFPVLDEATA